MRREYFPSIASDETEWPVAPGSAFYAVRLGGRQIGIATTTIDTLSEGLSIDDRLTLDVPAEAGKRSRRLLNRTTALLSRNLHVKSWRTSLVDDTRRSSISGDVEGDSALVLIIASGLAAETLAVQLERPIILPSVLPFRLRYAGNLRAGASVEASTFDPIALRFRSDRFRVGPDSMFILPDSAVYDSAAGRWMSAHVDSVRAWRLDSQEGGIPLRRWIDSQGLTVYASTPLGITVERSAFELVSANYRKRRAASPVPVPGSVNLAGINATSPKSPAVDSVVLGVTDPAGSGLRVGLNHAQRLEWLGLQPAATDSVDRPDSARLAAFLGTEPLVQVEDSGIRTEATRIAGKTSDASVIAERLAARVRHVRPAPKESGSWSAARVLTANRGDGDSRINLFLALARSLGIPARRVAGVIRTGTMYSSAGWAEIYDDGWKPVELDPLVSSADFRIRLTVGTLGQPLSLIPLIGQVKVEDVTPVRRSQP
ncbi:MAG: transglutaminase-like domain-containing protein [Gemmatimonadota bacterium]